MNWALAISLVVFVPLVSALVMAIAPTSTSGRVLTLVINIPMYLWLVGKSAYRSTWINGATGSLLVLLALVLISVVFASVYLGLDREHAGSFANERLQREECCRSLWPARPGRQSGTQMSSTLSPRGCGRRSSRRGSTVSTTCSGSRAALRPMT